MLLYSCIITGYPTGAIGPRLFLALSFLVGCSSLRRALLLEQKMGIPHDITLGTSMCSVLGEK